MAKQRIQFGMRPLLAAIGLACVGLACILYFPADIPTSPLWVLRFGGGGACFGAAAGLLLGRPTQWAIVGAVLMFTTSFVVSMHLAFRGFHGGS